MRTGHAQTELVHTAPSFSGLAWLVDLGADAAQFIERLEAGHWFDLQAYTDADVRRSATYAGLRQAHATASSTIDLAGYLAGLEMLGSVAPAQRGDLPRLAQMELKTNQFNLTSRRYTQAHLESHVRRADGLVLCLHLRDRFADHGLVGSLVAVHEDDAMRIDSWLMSCRVFSRTAEQFMLSALARIARVRGARALIGEYRATARNAVVADLYRRLGFVPWSDDGRLWRRDLGLPLDDLASVIADAQP